MEQKNKFNKVIKHWNVGIQSFLFKCDLELSFLEKKFFDHPVSFVYVSNNIRNGCPLNAFVCNIWEKWQRGGETFVTNTFFFWEMPSFTLLGWTKNQLILPSLSFPFFLRQSFTSFFSAFILRDGILEREIFSGSWGLLFWVWQAAAKPKKTKWQNCFEGLKELT